MNKDNSISTAIENVKNLISHIKSLELQIRGLQEVLDHKGTEKKAFNRNWQKKCNHPEFYKITIPEEGIPSADNKNSKNRFGPRDELSYIGNIHPAFTKYLFERKWPKHNRYCPSSEIESHPKMIFCKCSVCGLEITEIKSIEYVKELEIQRLKDYRDPSFDLITPISDIAQNLYHKKIEEFTSLEQEIEDLHLKQEKLKEELKKLRQGANEIAEILNNELGIKHTEYVCQRSFVDPVYTDRFYKD